MQMAVVPGRLSGMNALCSGDNNNQSPKVRFGAGGLGCRGLMQETGRRMADGGDWLGLAFGQDLSELGLEFLFRPLLAHFLDDRFLIRRVFEDHMAKEFERSDSDLTEFNADAGLVRSRNAAPHFDLQTVHSSEEERHRAFVALKQSGFAFNKGTAQADVLENATNPLILIRNNESFDFGWRAGVSPLSAVIRHVSFSTFLRPRSECPDDLVFSSTDTGGKVEIST